MSKFPHGHSDAFVRTSNETSEDKVRKNPVTSGNASYFLKMEEESKKRSYQVLKGYSPASERLRRKSGKSD